VVNDTLWREKLLTLDETRERLATTEPLGVVPILRDDRAATWNFAPDWAFTLDTAHGTSRVDASIVIDGDEYPLTKDAVLTAASAFGLPASHAKQLPAHLMKQEMNYWFGAGRGNTEFNVLTVGKDKIASAFVKPTKRPFSNLDLLDAVVQQIRARMGNTDIFVDYKFSHSLVKTDVRLVIPDLAHTIDSATLDDRWFGGIHFANSLIARDQTSVESYLFRLVCTNGATSQFGEGGKWNRRSQGQEEDEMLRWARHAVDEVFDTLPRKWAEVRKLTEVNIEGNAEGILREVFQTYKVPYTQQNEIISQMVDADELSMYELMNAITILANDPLLKPERADTLMRIGGSIPTALFDPLNDRLWKEGHLADPDAVSPYEVKVAA
jgi:hypothetical protein